MTTDGIVQHHTEKFALIRIRHIIREDSAVMLLPSDLVPRDAFPTLRIGALVDIDEIRMDARGARAFGARVVAETDARYAVATCKSCGDRFLVAPGFPNPPGRCRSCKTVGTRTPIESAPPDVAAAAVIDAKSGDGNSPASVRRV